MSFAAQTKKELTLIEADRCCEKAELSALIRMNGSVSVVQPQSHSGYLNRKCRNRTDGSIRFIKKHFDVHTELLVRKKMRLKKNNVYIVRIPAKVQEILSELRIVSEGFMFNQGIDKEIIRKTVLQTIVFARRFLGRRIR